MTAGKGRVRQLRVVVEAEDYEAAVAFFRLFQELS